MEKSSVQVEEKIQLRQSCINTHSISFSETESLMCVYDKSTENELVIINLDNPEKSIRKEILAEAVIMNTDGKFVALKCMLLI